MKTPLGEYLEKHKSNRAKISSMIGVSEDRLNALSNENTAILYADELYPILYVANFYAGKTEEQFDDSVSEIILNRNKGIIINSLNDLSPSAQLFAKYTQSKNVIETAIGMPKNKISKLIADPKKRATADEVIKFCDGMELDILQTFKSIYGDINLTQDKTNVKDKD
ncbi:hypothetical protein [Sphingobacterium sp. JUb56]|uniref:hypothetical protein n=1 Tax=Sphingobacterium sp. JUb56 TaxID=2587145 RepID=UPI0016176E9E|nr:hypothetical protein [Sphingobacterium sp. JUb56]MBB2951562.1 plasmid maintenance system antidote protein VapI [Sphingobacterium sp. JUb56]